MREALLRAQELAKLHFEEKRRAGRLKAILDCAYEGILAIDEHGKVDIYLSRFRPMKTTFYGGDERCLIKLVVDAASQKILGCHVVGPDAPEIIQMAAIALKMGVTKQQWDSTCAVHPTLAEELVTMRDKYVPQGAAA